MAISFSLLYSIYIPAWNCCNVRDAILNLLGLRHPVQVLMCSGVALSSFSQFTQFAK